MLRPVHPDSATLAAETTGRQLATFVRGNLNFSVERVSDSPGRPIGAGIRSPTPGYAARSDVVGENGLPGRSRLGIRTGNSERMRLIVGENGRCMIISNPAASRVGEGGPLSPARTAGRPRSSEGWDRGDPDSYRSGRLTVGGPLSPAGGVRTARSSSGSLPRLGRPLVAGAVCTSPSLPADVPVRSGGAQSPGGPTAGWWKEKQKRDSEGLLSAFNVTSTAQRTTTTSKDDDGKCYEQVIWRRPHRMRK